MRILVVQESDWIARGPHQSHHLMERLSKRGHEIRVIDYEIMWRLQGKRELISKRQVFENVHKAVEDGAVTVIRPPIIKVPVLNYVSLIYTHWVEIQRQINEFKPDVIVGFGILNSNIAIRLAKKNNIPFVYYIIDELHHLVPENAFREFAKRIESLNIKNADKVISINEGLREYTIGMGANPEKTDVIRAGIDVGRFLNADGKSIRKKYKLDDEDIVLFFMGWLYEFSGLYDIAIEMAKNNNPHIKLLILGKGDLWEKLEYIMRKYALEGRLILVNWVPYGEVPEYIAAADVCILPAHDNEIMRNIVPIKLYEYMAAGKPIIATKLYGVWKEFGDGNGIIYINKPSDLLCLVLKSSQEICKSCDLEKNSLKKMGWEYITQMFEKSICLK